MYIFTYVEQTLGNAYVFTQIYREQTQRCIYTYADTYMHENTLVNPCIHVYIRGRSSSDIIKKAVWISSLNISL